MKKKMRIQKACRLLVEKSGATSPMDAFSALRGKEHDQDRRVVWCALAHPEDRTQRHRNFIPTPGWLRHQFFDAMHVTGNCFVDKELNFNRKAQQVLSAERYKDE